VYYLFSLALSWLSECRFLPYW